MRLSRRTLTRRLRGPDAPPVILLEAPSGYGKSSLIRELTEEGAVRVRSHLPDGRLDPDHQLVVDDAQRLSPDERTRLIAHIENASSPAAVIVAGHLLDDDLIDAAGFAGGELVGADRLRVTASDLAESLDGAPPEQCASLVAAADGEIKTIMTVLDVGPDSLGPATARASEIVASHASGALRRLDDDDAGIVALLSRTAGIAGDRLAELGGSDVLGRLLTAGVPVFRQLAGIWQLATPWAFRTAALDLGQVRRFVDGHEAPIESVELLIEAGAPDEAALTLAGVNESITSSVNPRHIVGLLSRLGNRVDRSPHLLLMRATANRLLGRTDDCHVDVTNAAAITNPAEGILRRRVDIEVARVRLDAGDAAGAAETTSSVLRRLGVGEERTFARAHEILASAAATSDARESLQRTADHLITAVGAWESCGEDARARACRVELAMGAFNQLGRYDEALAQLAMVLAAPTITDEERPLTRVVEGFTLTSAGRLDAAQIRFDTAADLARAQDNPRLLAAAAWGMALVYARRNDLYETDRWIAAAQNTALGDADSNYGVPFLCDVATALGGLGQLDEARSYLDQAQRGPDVFNDQVRMTAFVLDARCGQVGDLEAQLARTVPAEWWRLQLVCADAAARSGDLVTAERLWSNCQRETAALNLPEPSSLGEKLTVDRLVQILRSAATDHDATSQTTQMRRPRVPGRRADVARVVVLHSPVTVERDGVMLEVPPGNPQRLLGLVAALGGTASFDQINEAVWPEDDVDTTRTRLRNVLMRLRRAVGEVIVRTSTGVRLAVGVGCDLHEFERLTADAAAASRMDPDLAGEFAEKALELATGTAFAEFEFEDWALSARRSIDHWLIDLLDLRSIQCEDAGDLTTAQALAERAVQLDRYTDSRYVRIAELMVMQGRKAAANAVLEEAAAASRELARRPMPKAPPTGGRPGSAESRSLGR